MTTEDEMSDGEHAMELVMPFTCVTSVGGPYDDRAFAAGFQAGQIDRSLAAIAAVEGQGMYDITVRTDLAPQLDLIAMRHGFTTDAEQDAAWPEWSRWTAVRSP